MNEDLYKLDVKDFSVIKRNMVEIVSLSKQLSFCFEDAEDYDNVEVVERVVKCCFKVLSRIINTEELEKLDDYQPTDINLTNVLKDIANETRSKLRFRRMVVIVECAENIHVMADSERLIACLFNLIVNAAQNSPLEETAIKISVVNLNDSVSVSVSDSGYGMDRDDLDEILADKSHRGGLAVVSKFCEKAGTQLFADSSADGGMTFSFRLPLADPSQAVLRSNKKLITDNIFTPANIYFSKVEDYAQNIIP